MRGILLASVLLGVGIRGSISAIAEDLKNAIVSEIEDVLHAQQAA